VSWGVDEPHSIDNHQHEGERITHAHTSIFVCANGVHQLLHRQQTKRVAENMRGELSNAFFTLADNGCHLVHLPFLFGDINLCMQFFPIAEESINYYNQKRCVDGKSLVLPSQLVIFLSSTLSCFVTNIHVISLYLWFV
jgi:hypothetical protein